MSNNSTRDQIIDAADQLFYEHGYEHTSFKHIAEAVQISRGNFYYHFKTKDEILQAVIERRLVNTRQMLAQWEAEGQSPVERIRCFIRILIMNQSKILRYGCPVGTLTSELAKLGHVAQSDANGLFTLFRDWLVEQFRLLGGGEDADELAMHLLARSQGVATLANAFNDTRFIEQEVGQMFAWLDANAERLAMQSETRKEEGDRCLS
ncbi:TetR family transcriptional regulator [Marinobacterium zhoushanense]|uniref:TetR family transcriptional regulator n=1 Tax=Marinobacterium zhoushanense TaxID=1679163 RepID=A0ABQ1KG32_9GAMM|nr:TetR/AcrR family transcriptional regulator [Marinobacterium zhoushanense]GGB94513.1 TetR family transcriptional regulator [Marinobacterium zhoushanense]